MLWGGWQLIWNVALALWGATKLGIFLLALVHLSAYNSAQQRIITQTGLAAASVADMMSARAPEYGLAVRNGCKHAEPMPASLWNGPYVDGDTIPLNPVLLERQWYVDQSPLTLGRVAALPGHSGQAPLGHPLDRYFAGGVVALGILASLRRLARLLYASRAAGLVGTAIAAPALTYAVGRGSHGVLETAPSSLQAGVLVCSLIVLGLWIVERQIQAVPRPVDPQLPVRPRATTGLKTAPRPDGSAGLHARIPAWRCVCGFTTQSSPTVPPAECPSCRNRDAARFTRLRNGPRGGTVRQ